MEFFTNTIVSFFVVSIVFTLGKKAMGSL
jgi:hypothetical protein